MDPVLIDTRLADFDAWIRSEVTKKEPSELDKFLVLPEKEFREKLDKIVDPLK